MPSVEKSPINQRFMRFRKKNGCVFCSFVNEPFEYRSSGMF